MDKLKVNLEGLGYYTEQIKALVDFLIIAEATDRSLVKGAGAVWSAIEHFANDIKAELGEAQDIIFQLRKHCEAKKAA